MEQKVNFSNYQQVSPTDLNNIQTFAEQSIDDVVFDTITPGRGYSGFATRRRSPCRRAGCT